MPQGWRPQPSSFANQLVESLEMFGESCEDAADLIRVAISVFH